MFDWSGKNGNKSGKSQGILISCVSGNPEFIYSAVTVECTCGKPRLHLCLWSDQKFLDVVSF